MFTYLVSSTTLFHIRFIPDDWKLAHIFPIPKPIKWNCDITKIRFIILLDTLRKAIVKVLINCLSRILAKHSVLKGRNYASLPEGSTETLIKLMQMVMKDT